MRTPTEPHAMAAPFPLLKLHRLLEGNSKSSTSSEAACDSGLKGGGGL